MHIIRKMILFIMLSIGLPILVWSMWVYLASLSLCCLWLGQDIFLLIMTTELLLLEGGSKVININPYPAEILKWNNSSYFFGTVHYHIKGYQDENLKLVSQQYRASSDCTDVQAGLALFWWQSLITFGVGRVRVNTSCKSKSRLVLQVDI